MTTVMYVLNNIITHSHSNRDETRIQAKEANALADFQHIGNIVRYYNSGLAKSPDWKEWKEWKLHKYLFA